MTTIKLSFGSKKYKSWVAEITGQDAKYGFARKFLNTDDRETAEVTLANGVYQINDQCASDFYEKAYIIVKDGEVTEIEKSEVLAALEAMNEPTMRKEIEALLASDKTAYEIAQATGMSPSNITDLRVGKRKIDNITLASAEKLHDYKVNGNMRTAEDKVVESLKIKGLKKAVGDFNDWQGHAVIFYDKEDRKAWTEVYASSNSWTEYHDDAVVSLHQKDDFLGRDNKTSMREIKRLILAL